VFKDGALLEPHVDVVRNADGTLNCADPLLFKWPKVPPFRLSQMRLADGRVVFHDAALPSRFSTIIGSLTGNFMDFSMSPDHDNLYSFERAKTVREYLLRQGGLEPSRIFLIDNSLESIPRNGAFHFFSSDRFQRTL
jgi:hypothetical protein